MTPQLFRIVRVLNKAYGHVLKWVLPKTCMSHLPIQHSKLRSLLIKTFRFNAALLMPSFGMTRKGAFVGIGLDKEGGIYDRYDIIGLCWKTIGDGLQHIRQYIDENAAAYKRSRRLAELSAIQRDHVVRKTCELFARLCEIGVRRGQIRRARVGASKILFAALPEVALPVDNLEWDYVFKTNDYGETLAIMTNEIGEWERKTGKHLDDLDPHQPTTLPSIYNVLAMSVRPLERLPKSRGTQAVLRVSKKITTIVNRSRNRQNSS